MSEVRIPPAPLGEFFDCLLTGTAAPDALLARKLLSRLRWLADTRSLHRATAGRWRSAFGQEDPMRLRHFASLGIAALLSGASPAAVPIAGAGASAGSSSGIGFQVPSVVDPIHTNGEPDVAIDVQGR